MWHHALAAIALITSAATTAAAENRQEQLSVAVAPEVILSGTLHLPDAAAPSAAVVLYPGSQGSTNLAGVAEHLASRGIAALDLSKRGVGKSGGSWREETIERQAEDALAAVRQLQARPDIDARRVGIVGHSQGGWVAQLAAARSSEPAFIVLLAGPSQTVLEQILTDEGRHLAGWGVPADEVEARVDMFRELLGAALTNPAVCGPEPKHYLCGLIGYDPDEALGKIRVPVLALYGERDPMTPPDVNESRLKEALAHLNPDRLETRIFSHANHMFWTSKSGLRDEQSRTRAYLCAGLSGDDQQLGPARNAAKRYTRWRGKLAANRGPWFEVACRLQGKRRE